MLNTKKQFVAVRVCDCYLPSSKDLCCKCYQFKICF